MALRRGMSLAEAAAMRDRDARPESPAPDAQLAPRDGAADDDEFERAAALAGDGEGPPIPTQHRKDQDPRAFL